MLQTIGNRIAQQQMMSTKWKMSRHVSQSLIAGDSSSVITNARLASTWNAAAAADMTQGMAHGGCQWVIAGDCSSVITSARLASTWNKPTAAAAAAA
jgi:hypothetical protein